MKTIYKVEQKNGQQFFFSTKEEAELHIKQYACAPFTKKEKDAIKKIHNTVSKWVKIIEKGEPGKISVTELSAANRDLQEIANWIDMKFVWRNVEDRTSKSAVISEITVYDSSGEAMV